MGVGLQSKREPQQWNDLFFPQIFLNLCFVCINRFSLKKYDRRCVTLVCLTHKILRYCKNMTSWRPSWIFSGFHKIWTKHPMFTKFTFLSLSHLVENNDTKYDLFFIKIKKCDFLGWFFASFCKKKWGLQHIRQGNH